MMDKPGQPDKARVYAFSNKRLVLLACMVLLLIALSIMLGIRIERHQQSASLIPREAPAPLEPVEPPPAVKAPVSKPAASPKAGTKPKAAPATKPSPKVAAPVKAAQPKEPAAAPAVAPQPSKPVAAPVVKAAQKAHYAVQVEASQDNTKAKLAVDMLKKKGFPSYLEETSVEGKGRFFRVMAGPYKTEAEATETQKALAKDSRFAGCYVRYLP